MKKILIIFTVLFALLFAGCGSQEEEVNPLNCGDYENGAIWSNNGETCSCNNGQISCVAQESSEDSGFYDEVVAEIKFNSDLESYEEEWLDYLKNKYTNSKIYHIRTVSFNCEGCYELSYKKDREVIKIKVLNGEKQSERTVRDDIVVEIENDDVCKLFSGEWNECPVLCPTDEVACQEECGLPTCEFDENKITYKKLGEQCGGIINGDCEFGLTCFYENQEDDYGVCEEK